MKYDYNFSFWLLRKCLKLETYDSSWVKGQTMTLTFSLNETSFTYFDNSN